MIRLEGVGLHGGAPSAVVLSACRGVTVLVHRGVPATLAALDVRGDERTTVARFPGGAEVTSIEHLLAALAGTGAFTGVRATIEGDELPLLDGAAASLARAIESVRDRSSDAPRARIARTATIEAHGGRYHFQPATNVERTVEVDYPASRFGRALRGTASWDGDVASFHATIAPARTFGAARELDSLRASGRAAHVPPGVVVALDVDDPRWAPRDAEEPVRHKLLDLIGDLAAVGATLVGSVCAYRPSHRASHAALARARAEGVITLPP